MTNETTIHICNLKLIVTEIYKFLNGLSPTIMNEVFQINECPYNLRNPRTLALKHKSTVTYGLATIAFKVPQIWQDIPLEIRNSESVHLFKSMSNRCKAYLVNVKSARHS